MGHFNSVQLNQCLQEKYQQPQIKDDTTLMAESKEELESLDKGERGERKGWLEIPH